MSAKQKGSGFTEAERAAMKERAKELTQDRGGKKKVDNAQAVLDAISEMPDDDRAQAERVHVLVTTHAPDLQPKTWYGMPAYVDKDGKVVCFFKNASKFDARYAILGFEESATLDDGEIWPVAFAIVEWTSAVEKKVVALIKSAVA